MPQRTELQAVELLAAEIRRIDRVRIGQHGVDTGPAEHGGGKRAGQTAACDRNVGVPQLHLPKRKSHK